MNITKIAANKQMKWIGLVKIFDKTMCNEWHSGSCTSYENKTGFDAEEEAQQFCDEVTEKYKQRTNREYQLTVCVLCYDEINSKNIEEFFKYM